MARAAAPWHTPRGRRPPGLPAVRQPQIMTEGPMPSHVCLTDGTRRNAGLISVTSSAGKWGLRLCNDRCGRCFAGKAGPTIPYIISWTSGLKIGEPSLETGTQAYLERAVLIVSCLNSSWRDSGGANFTVRLGKMM